MPIVDESCQRRQRFESVAPGLKLKPIARLDALVDAGVDRVAALEPSAATIDGVPLRRRSSGGRERGDNGRVGRMPISARAWRRH